MQIQVDDLHYTYPSGVVALRGVTTTIEAGEQVAIIGQNGSGKTTLVKHLNGLLHPSHGTVRIGEWQTTDHTVAQLAHRVGYVFQNPDDQLFKSKVEDEVRFGPHNLGFAAEEIEAHVANAVALLGLEAVLQKNPYDLTPTERKWVALATVIAMDTPILVLDEPTTGQDYQASLQLAGLLAKLRRQKKTLIAISHDIDFVAKNFARVLVMGEGVVLLDGVPQTVFAERETLARTYVTPPQLTRLGERLGLNETVYTVDRFLEVLATPGEKESQPDAASAL